jgi:hypothetical protein
MVLGTKLGSDKLKTHRGSGSNKLKADISVADGEVFSTAPVYWAWSVGGRGTPVCC